MAERAAATVADWPSLDFPDCEWRILCRLQKRLPDEPGEYDRFVRIVYVRFFPRRHGGLSAGNRADAESSGDYRLEHAGDYIYVIGDYEYGHYHVAESHERSDDRGYPGDGFDAADDD